MTNRSRSGRTERITRRKFPDLREHECLEWAVDSGEVSKLRRGSRKRLENVLEAFGSQHPEVAHFLLLTVVSQGSGRPSLTERCKYLQGDLTSQLSNQGLSVIDVHHGAPGSKSAPYAPSFLGINGPVDVALQTIGDLSRKNRHRLDLFLTTDGLPTSDKARRSDPGVAIEPIPNLPSGRLLPIQRQPAASTEDVLAAIHACLAAESTDAESFARRRKEQGALREYLLEGHDYGTCICCGEQLPASLLVAAHIKKRSECSEAERLDFENVAALMCVLGCDAVYERGMLTADDEGWQWSSFTPNAVRDRIRPATGAEFLTEGNRQYFEAHRRSHT